MLQQTEMGTESQDYFDYAWSYEWSPHLPSVPSELTEAEGSAREGNGRVFLYPKSDGVIRRKFRS
jgi:hypothetical protein